jgi:hypothetical protein
MNLKAAAIYVLDRRRKDKETETETENYTVSINSPITLLINGQEKQS